MSKYTVKAEVLHTWTYHENYEVEIDAENEKAAISGLHEQLTQSEVCALDASYDDYDVYGIKASLIREKPEKPVRCDRTLELF